MTQPSHIIWSAQACPFRRAGVYYGLSPAHTHDLIARWLLPRRGVHYPGGRLRTRPDTPAPLNYFAVRDPAAVRVVPVRRAGSREEIEEFAHVSLVFPLRNLTTAPAAEPALTTRDPEHTAAGFVVTVGLRVDREAEFHERLVLAHPDLPYAALCERIMALREEFSN